MNLLQIIASANPAAGGPIEGILRQNEAWPGSGRFEIVTLDAPDAPFLKNLPIKVHAAGPPLWPRIRGNPLARYGLTLRLVPWLRSHLQDYDAIIVNGLWNFSTFAAAKTLPLCPIPYFVFTHGMLDPWFRQTYPLKHALKQMVWRMCEGPLLDHAAAVLFTCEEERVLARGQFRGHAGYREQVVGYGTADPPPADPAQEAAFRALVPRLGQKPYLLFLSRVHPKKGCDLLVEGFARFAAAAPGTDLVIAGPDPSNLRAGLEARALVLGIADRIHWPGMVSGPAKWGAFRAAEAFVLPSHQENFGLVVAEAMACGTPVLITDKVNIWREVLASGGGMVDGDDERGIARLLDRWRVLTADERSRMRHQAAAGFLAHFHIKAHVGRLTALIESRIEASGGKR